MGMKQCQARTQITGWLKCEGCLFLLFLIGVEGNLGMRSSKFLHLTSHTFFSLFFPPWGCWLGDTLCEVYFLAMDGSHPKALC